MPFSPEDLRRIAAAIRKTENDMRLHSPGPAADRITSQEPFALNHNNRKVNLVAPIGEPTGGSKLYPARWYSFDRSTVSTAAEKECWAFEPNDNELEVGHIYTNAQRVGINAADNLPIYAIDAHEPPEQSGSGGDDPDGGGGGGGGVFVPPDCTYSGGEGVQIDVVTDVCPIFAEVCGVEACDGSLPSEEVSIGSGGAALLMTGINVQKTPICLGVGQVGEPFCDPNPICCTDPDDTFMVVCCENPLPAKLYATIIGEGEFCLIGKTVELTWSVVDECWIGFDEECGCYVCFCCDPDSGLFNISFSETFFCIPDCPAVDRIDTEPGSNSCDPFEFIAPGPREYYCCGGVVGDAVGVVVTA